MFLTKIKWIFTVVCVGVFAVALYVREVAFEIKAREINCRPKTFLRFCCVPPKSWLAGLWGAVRDGMSRMISPARGFGAPVAPSVRSLRTNEKNGRNGGRREVPVIVYFSCQNI